MNPWEMDWKPASAAQAAAAPTAKPWEQDWQKGGEKLKKEPEESQSLTHQTVDNLIDAADLVAGIPSMALGVGADIGTRIKGLAQGEPRKETAQRAQQVSQIVAEPLAAPVKKFVKALGYDDKNPSHVEQAMGWLAQNVHKGGEWIEKQTKGILLAEDVDSIVNAGMLGAGAKGGDLAMRAGIDSVTKPKDKIIPGPSKSEADAIIDQIKTGQDTNRENLATKRSLDQNRNADKQANDLMQSGASVKDVERAVKQNPLIGEKLEAIRQKRADAAAAFDRDFGARQGKVLPPKGLPPGTKGPVKSPAELPQGETPKALPKEAGQADPKLLAGIAAAGGLAAWAFANPDDAKKMAPMVAAAGIILPGMALGSMLKGEKYSLKTLDRLPQNAVSFTKRQVTEQLARQDVSKAERDVLQGVLDKTKGETIPAADLVKEFKLATGDHTLEAKETGKYSDYGVDRLDRKTAPDSGPIEGEVFTNTTLYQLPFELSDANHFNDPRLFGWTRSFKEDGIRHVVEVQSDLAQHAKGAVGPEEHLALIERAAAIRELQRMDEAQKKAIDTDKAFPAGHTTKDFFELARKLGLPSNPADGTGKTMRQAEVELAEIRVKTEASAVASQVGPLLKHWPRRLIREELARASQSGDKVVRFATADTVAKVEGWPREGILERVARAPLDEGEQPGFRPEHQSIYNRYNSDITKFLKSLGGKDHTDPLGHTWIEVPTKDFKGPVQMYGKADPKLLAAIAAAGIGAYVSDDRVKGALLGAALGAGLTHLVTRGPKPGELQSPQTPEAKAGWAAAKEGQDLVQSAGKVMRERGETAAREFITGFKIGQMSHQGVREAEAIIGERFNEISSRQRIIHNNYRDLKDQMPGVVEQELVADALDKGRTDSLPFKLVGSAAKLRGLFKDIGERAVQAGVVEGLRENYITHIVDWKVSDKSPTAALMEKLIGGGGRESVSPNSRFGKERKYGTFEELQQALESSGLALKTRSAPEIYKIYAQAMEKTIANKNMVEGLKLVTDSEGKPMLHKITEKTPVPRGWEIVNSPALRGYAVSPDIAAQVRFAMNQSDLGGMLQAAHGLSQIVKRSNVVGSLFHAKSLAESSWSAAGPVRTLKDLGLAGVDKLAGTKYSGITKSLEAFRKGGLGDEVDGLIKAGLVVTVPEDVKIGMLSSLGAIADHAIARFGPTTHSAERAGGVVEKYTLGMFDHFTWDYLHTGLKINTAMYMLEKARRDRPEIPEEKLRKDISSHVNDAFGGLNWFQVATDTNNEFLKGVKLQAFNHQGRQLLQTVLFAPDWTASTVRNFTAGFGYGSGLKGLLKPASKADFARRYQIRTALTYAILVDAAQYAVSGHHIWQNKDPTRIEFPDGTSIQPMKHAAEPYHWMMDPTRELANKLGFVPQAINTVLTGQAYIGGPKLKDNSVTGKTEALAGKALPITAQGAREAPQGEGAKRAVLGELGFPVYGKSKSRDSRSDKRRKDSR